MDCIKVIGSIKCRSDELWNAENYKGLEAGYYIIDDGVALTLMFVNNTNTLEDLPLLDGFPLRRDYVVTEVLFEEKLDTCVDVMQKLEDIQFAVDLIPENVKELVSDQSVNNMDQKQGVDLDAITKLVAVSQKPDLYKE